ncbi:MAG: cytochrome c [Hyphomicrobiaceae bacterium]
MKPSLAFAASAIVCFFVSSEANAMSLGEFEYKNSCAQCHGTSGKGDGPFGENLKTPPSDLTMLQKKSGGVFPASHVYSVIEGTVDVRVHGSREMPIWGRRFRARIKESEEEFFAGDANEYATTRILALIDYLSTLQSK